MKINSAKMAPNSKMPPTNTVRSGCIYQGCSGMRLLTWLVPTASSMASIWAPTYDPTNSRDTEIPNHIPSLTNIVMEGTAPEGLCPQISKFSTKDSKDGSWEQHGRHECHGHPVVAIEQLVEACLRMSRNHTREREEQHDRLQQATPACRRHEAQQREYQRDTGHHKHLRA
jgi:hypothetical protein